MLQTFLLTSGLDVEDNVQSVETMDNEIVMEALGSGQFCKVTRFDISTGIFDLPKLQNSSDDEGEAHNLAVNAQDEVQGRLDLPVEPFQSLDQLVDPLLESKSPDQIRTLLIQSEQLT
jgi:hypothetical protein